MLVKEPTICDESIIISPRTKNKEPISSQVLKDEKKEGKTYLFNLDVLRAASSIAKYCKPTPAKNGRLFKAVSLFMPNARQTIAMEYHEISNRC